MFAKQNFICVKIDLNPINLITLAHLFTGGVGIEGGQVWAHVYSQSLLSGSFHDVR